MKQHLSISHEAQTKYPYIGIYDNIVVFFEGAGTGMCLHPGDSANRAGEYSSSWKEVEFTPLNGSITLEQKA